jgi:hypothetical protein
MFSYVTHDCLLFETMLCFVAAVDNKSTRTGDHKASVEADKQKLQESIQILHELKNGMRKLHRDLGIRCHVHVWNQL